MGCASSIAVRSFTRSMGFIPPAAAQVLVVYNVVESYMAAAAADGLIYNVIEAFTAADCCYRCCSIQFC